MASKKDEEDSPCCCIRFPSIPDLWMMFIDFAFTLGTTIVYIADVITDIITLKMYWDQGWHTAFGLSMGFIIGPSILLAILECQFLMKTYGKNIKWGTVILRTALNIPFQLTVIWYHCKLSYRYMKIWLSQKNSTDKSAMKSNGRGASMSNLADIDDRANSMERRAFMEVPVDDAAASTAYPINSDHTWWKQLTREEWLSHLNKMKLTESMLESLPQLLINLYLIVRYPNTAVVQYISAALSYLSLCGGIVRYDKTRKDNEAERLMVDRTLLHSRVFATRLEWPQILFLSIYKGSFLAARILALVFFTVYFQVYVLVFVFVHWVCLLAYLVYLWYPTDMRKKTRQLVQADYKFRAYMFLSQDFLSVLHNSLVGIFINVRPRNYAFLGQPYCYIFWYYFIYVIENVVLFMLPGVYLSMRDEEIFLVERQYYVVMICELLLNVIGTIMCIAYYFFVHKMHLYSRNAYPQFMKMYHVMCCCHDNVDPPLPKEWTVCKQAETSELFFLRREKLKEYKSGFTTVVRANRRHGRNLECFVDDRGQIFYAPRSKLFKKIPTREEEELVNMRKEASRQSLDNIDRDTQLQPSNRSESHSTVHNERLVGEEPSFVSKDIELRLLTKSTEKPPPLPDSPPVAHTTSSIRGSIISKSSDKSSVKTSQCKHSKSTKSSDYAADTKDKDTTQPSDDTSSLLTDAQKNKNDTSTSSPKSTRSSKSRSHHSAHQPTERYPGSPESQKSSNHGRGRKKEKSPPRSFKSTEAVKSPQKRGSRSPSDRKREEKSRSPQSSSNYEHQSSKNKSRRSRNPSSRHNHHKKSSTNGDENDLSERSAPVGQSWV